MSIPLGAIRVHHAPKISRCIVEVALIDIVYLTSSPMI